MCRVLDVSSSGYYAWAKRAPSARATSDAALIERIGAVHAASHGTYGSPRVHAELVEGGLSISRKRVARLMKAASLAGVSRRRFVQNDRARWRRQAPDPSSALCRWRAVKGFGSPISPIFQPGPAFSTSPSCSTPSAGGSLAGRWR
jgi:putative transposase